MRKKKTWGKHIKEILFVAMALILAIIFMYVFIFVDFGKKLSPDSEYRVKIPQDDQQEIWKGVFKDNKIIIDNPTLGVILPNDKAIFSDLNDFYNGLAEVKNPDNIVLIGGANKTLNKPPIQICSECIFETEFGNIQILKSLAEEIEDKDIAKITDTAFSYHTGLINQFPFIKYYFPEAKVLPIAIADSAQIKEIIELRDYLDKNLLGDSLVIASVNFSDQLFKSAADLHDKSAIDTINNFEFNNISGLDVESPKTIYAILSFMEKWGQTKSNLVHSFNTQDLSPDPLEKTKSFMFWTFNDMEMQPNEAVSILATGDLYEEAELNIMDKWILPDNYDAAKDQSAIKQLRDIRESDDRFLKGFDFLAFDIAETGCKNYSQNELKIAFCKFAEDENVPKDEMLNTVYESAINSDLLYLIFEYSGEDLSSERIKIAEDFVQNGTDIFVGRGLKDIVPMKYFNGALIFYSLGDFLTSPKLANELTSDSEGLMLGLYITSSEYNISLFPISIISGYPKYISLSERLKFFTEYSKDLNLNSNTLNSDIVNGVFTIYR